MAIHSVSKGFRPVRFSTTRRAAENLPACGYLMTEFWPLGPLQPVVGVGCAIVAVPATILAVPWDVAAAPFRRELRARLEFTAILRDSAGEAQPGAKILIRKGRHEGWGLTERWLEVSTTTATAGADGRVALPLEFFVGSSKDHYADFVVNDYLIGSLQVSKRHGELRVRYCPDARPNTYGKNCEKEPERIIWPQVAAQ